MPVGVEYAHQLAVDRAQPDLVLLQHGLQRLQHAGRQRAGEAAAAPCRCQRVTSSPGLTPAVSASAALTRSSTTRRGVSSRSRFDDVVQHPGVGDDDVAAQTGQVVAGFAGLAQRLVERLMTSLDVGRRRLAPSTTPV